MARQYTEIFPDRFYIEIQANDLADQRRANPTLIELARELKLPLIATNCAVLGLSLINIQEGHSFVTMLVYDFGSSAGFTLAMVMFAGMRERLALARVPEVFSGAPIAFILASLMSLAFMGFSGLNLK